MVVKVAEKVKIVLQDIAEGFDFNSLPPSWQTLNLTRFSKAKTLYDYQEDALKYAIKILHLYFERAQNYRDDESAETNAHRKQFLLSEYERRGFKPKLLDVKNSRRTRKIYKILSEFFPSEKNTVAFRNLINRMAFWMATGAGKTLVLVKLIGVIKTLIERGEIPPRDILILTHRDDLVEQVRRHIEEFNRDNILKVRAWSLKDYVKVKRGGVLPGGEDFVDIFIYRSDLIGEEEKEKTVDYKFYENGGNWYILLDEAHKGDKDESKRQAYYSLISRNGFLFNFSATFTDPPKTFTPQSTTSTLKNMWRGDKEKIFTFPNRNLQLSGNETNLQPLKNRKSS